jgi:tellurite resistance protein
MNPTPRRRRTEGRLRHWQCSSIESERTTSVRPDGEHQMNRALRSGTPLKGLDADDAFIALLIGAMDASGHVSAAEAARAHNIIWSTRRFRRRDGDDVGQRIERARALIEAHGVAAVLETGARKIPRPHRPAAFAVAADLVLVDGTMERAEARFLRQLALDLGLRPPLAKSILDVLRIKNSV